MSWWVVLLIGAGVAAALWLAARAGWIDFSDKRGGAGSGSFGAIDEIFAPSRHEAQLEVERQQVVPAPAPLAGDDDRGISLAAPAVVEPDDAAAARAAHRDRFKGSIRLDLDR